MYTYKGWQIRYQTSTNTYHVYDRYGCVGIFRTRPDAELWCDRHAPSSYIGPTNHDHR